MTKPLAIGVIGLGRKWHKRYKPALLALKERFLVRGVYDQYPFKAEQEAAQLGCQTMAGPTQLLANKDLDAVLFIDRQWFELWPIKQACSRKLPIYSAVLPSLDDRDADAIFQQVQQSRLPVMMEMLPQMSPASSRLRQILRDELGPARFLLCDSVLRYRETGQSEGGHLSRWGLALLNWCASLLGEKPIGVTVVLGKNEEWESQVWEFPQGRGAQIIFRRAKGTKPRLRLDVNTEQGLAQVRYPNWVGWTSADGSQWQWSCQPTPMGQLALNHFYQSLGDELPPEPNFPQTLEVLEWLRAARRSSIEGRRVAVVPG
jgi:predicted dehydrogenase